MSKPADDAAKSVSTFSKVLSQAKQQTSSVDAALLKTAIAEAKVATETKRLAKELDGYTKQLQPMKKITAEWGNMFKSFAGFRKEADGRWIFNVADGLSSVLSVAERLAGAFYDVAANAIKVGAQSDKTGRAIKLNLGGKAGEDTLQYLRRVSEASGGQYTQDQLRTLLLPAIQQGYKLPDQQRLLGAGLDAKQRGLDAGGAISALTNVRTNRQFGVDTLNALGFGSVEDKTRIAKRLGGVGVSPNAALGTVGQFTEISARKSQRVYDILLDELAKRNPSGKLGESAAFAQQSPTATLERLANLPELLGEKLSANGALAPFYATLDRFTAAMTNPRFIERLSWVVDKLGTILDGLGELLKGDSQADKERASGRVVLQQTDSGKVIDSVTAQQALNLAKQQLKLQGRKESDASYLPMGELTTLARTQFYQDRKDAGKGTVLLPQGSEAQQFGYDQEIGAELARKASAAGPVKMDGSADDFIWRNGRAIEIDPQDSVVGFKRGGSLGAGEGGRHSGGGGLSLTLQFGDVHLSGAGKSTPEMAQDFLAEVALQAPASQLMSALEQFAAEVGAT